MQNKEINKASSHSAKVKNRAQQLLRKHATHSTSYEVNFLGIRLVILPDVFSPVYGEGASLLANFINSKREEAVLDMGTGSGALAILAARKGSKVVAVDISPVAVTCATLNAKRLGLEAKIDVRRGNLFAPIKAGEKFSLILFNPPFMEGNPKSYLQSAMYDRNYQTLNKFFQQVEQYLTDTGRILLAFSDAGDIQHLEHLISKLDFTFKILKKVRWNLNFFVYEIKRKV